MQFVNIPTPYSAIDDMVINLTGRTMVSLFEIMNTKRFGILEETISHADRRKKLIEYSNRVRQNNGEVYVDSGGYSIISSNLNYYDIEEYEEYYQDFLEYDSELYDYIFSLDIPYGITDEKIQDRQTVHAFNYRSLDRSLEILSKNQTLIEKFIFVYHFRMLDLWEVWQKLYQELDIGKKIIHRAIGGLVGLRGMNRHQQFSTFTFIVFRLFCDFVQSGSDAEEFKIHLLGVNHPIDRFLIAIMEKALNVAIGNKTRITFSYDSVRYNYDAWKKFGKTQYWDFRNGQLTSGKLIDVPDAMLRRVYPSDHTYIKTEIANHLAGSDLQNSNIFVPLSIHSQMQLDEFFMHVVNKVDIVSRMNFGGQTTKTQVNKQIGEIMDDLFANYKTFFSRDKKKKKKSMFEKRIEDELKIVAGLLNWLAYINDPEKLERVTRAEIMKMRT
jgi:hypothetical protein